MKIFINGETREVQNKMNLDELLKLFSLPQERIAIELNKEVVRRKDWEDIQIKNDDKIEIIHFVGGGWHDFGMEIAECGLRAIFSPHFFCTVFC